MVTIGQGAEGLSVGIGADHLLVSHHPGGSIVHLNEGEANSSACEPKTKANTLSLLLLLLLLPVFASDSSVCPLSLLLCEHGANFCRLFAKEESLRG